MPEKFEGVVCWKPNRISQVINKEALSVSVADFLATHTPFNQIRYGSFDETSRSLNQQAATITEQELLENLQRYRNEDRHVFTILQGVPGTGKSHLIRWLKEHYELTKHNNADVVVLIERARCNLRDTLRQIINSGVFNESEMKEQLDKLKFASTALSTGNLADKLLDSLRQATQDEDLLDKSELQDLYIIRKCIGYFLLDADIREELKKENGPIDRLVRFLSDSSKGKINRDTLPEFYPEDFKLNTDLLRKLQRGGAKREALELAKKLVGIDSTADKARHDLSRYLSNNKIINYAVGAVSSISASDLKQIFLDLRQSLKKRGRNLVLFIEDVAAFTGIDIGLIDVLVTQHSGEGGRDFCRIFSVIGLTEDYYKDKLPDNIKSRATHTFSLDVVKNQRDNRDVSDMLETPAAVAQMAVRYLNGMRLNTEQVAQWHKRGAHEYDLPNACIECEYVSTCHSAFGNVNIGTEENPIEVGLYPFNQAALWNMYDRTTTIARTPRTLLGSVLEHVLDKHGLKIKDGQFPPSLHLGSEFEEPPIDQRDANFISTAGGIESGRLLTLGRFWMPTNDAGKLLFSQLSPDVYTAFGLTPLEVPNSERESQAAAKIIDKPTKKKATNSFVQDIDAWLKNGAKLQNYERLSELLYFLILNSIDWEAHNISQHEIGLKFERRARLIFEDQAANAQLDEYILLKRSPELGVVLQAVTDTTMGYAEWEPEQFGVNLLILRRWLYKIEPEVIEFVRRPRKEQQEPLPLLQMMMLNNTIAGWLLGKLGLAQATSALLLALLKDTQMSSETLKQLLDNEFTNKSRSQLWRDLLKNIDPKKLTESRQTLLNLLNRPQGASQEVRFINAPAALDTLIQIQQSEWQLPEPNALVETNLQDWNYGQKLYQAFRAYLPQALAAERDSITDYLRRLQKLLSNNTPEQVFAAMDELSNILRQQQTHFKAVHQFNFDPTYNPQELAALLAGLQPILEMTNSQPGVSVNTELVKLARNYCIYLEHFANEFEKIRKDLQNKIETLRISQAGNSTELANREYTEVSYELGRFKKLTEEPDDN